MLTPIVTPIPTPPARCHWHSVGRHGGPCPACMRWKALRLKAQEAQAERAAAEAPLLRRVMAGVGA